MRFPTVPIAAGLKMIGKALSATPNGLLTLNGLRGPLLGPSLEGGFTGAGYAFPRSQFVDGFYYTMQNASYAMIWQTQPNVETVVGYLAQQFVQVGMELYDDNEGSNGKLQYDHPAAESARWPMGMLGHYGGREWRQKMALDYFVYKNAYSVIVRPPGADTAVLMHVPAYAVGVRGANRLVPDAYRILYADGTGQILKPEEVIHWRGPNVLDPRVGWSPMEQLRDVLIEASTRQAANIEFNRSGRIKGGVIKRPIDAPEWSDTARERFEEGWSARARGMTGGKSAVLEEGMDWTDIGVTPREAEIILAYQINLSTVCNLYGIHPALFMANPGSTDLTQARNQVFTDVLPGHAALFAEVVTLKLVKGTYGTRDMHFAFDFTAKLEGEEDRLQKLVGAAGRPILTVNESRARAGLGPLPGGDELVLMTNVVGVGPGGGLPSPNVMPPADPNTPAQDGSHRDGAPPAAKAFADLQARYDAAAERMDTKAMRELSEEYAALAVRVEQAKSLDAMGGGVDASALTAAHPDIVTPIGAIPRRKAAAGRRTEYAAVMEGIARRHFTRQRNAMKSASSNRASAQRWDSELTSDITKAMTADTQREGEIVAARLMGTYDAGRTDNYIAHGAKAMARGINQTTQKMLDEARAQYKTDSATDPALAQVFDHALTVRAAEIGRTYATKASAFATHEAAMQNQPVGGIRLKEWVPGSATGRHSQMAGEVVPMGTAFSNGMMFPGDPTAPTDETANCGCSLDCY